MRGTRAEVERCGSDVGVPHHLRKRVNVASTFEHQRCEGMAQFVRAEFHAEGFDDAGEQMSETVVGEPSVVGERGEELGTGFV